MSAAELEHRALLGLFRVGVDGGRAEILERVENLTDELGPRERARHRS